MVDDWNDAKKLMEWELQLIEVAQRFDRGLEIALTLQTTVQTWRELWKIAEADPNHNLDEDPKDAIRWLLAFRQRVRDVIDRYEEEGNSE